jgi:hypothetical protein
MRVSEIECYWLKHSMKCSENCEVLRLLRRWGEVKWAAWINDQSLNPIIQFENDQLTYTSQSIERNFLGIIVIQRSDMSSISQMTQSVCSKHLTSSFVWVRTTLKVGSVNVSFGLKRSRNRENDSPTFWKRHNARFLFWIQSIVKSSSSKIFIQFINWFQVFVKRHFCCRFCSLHQYLNISYTYDSEWMVSHSMKISGNWQFFKYCPKSSLSTKNYPN